MRSPYIELTNATSKQPMRINVIHIVAVLTVGTSTCILTTPGIEYFVVEDYSMVNSKMEAALNG